RAAEEDPADAHEDEREQRAQRIEPGSRAGGPGRGPFPSAPRPLQPQQGAVVSTPDDEVPARTMPEAPEEHRDHQIAVGAEAAAAIAAEGQVQVVAQP